MKQPNTLQVATPTGRRYSGTKVSTAILGTACLIRLMAGYFKYELPISDDELFALAGVLVACMGHYLRRGMEK